MAGRIIALATRASNGTRPVNPSLLSKIRKAGGKTVTGVFFRAPSLARRRFMSEKQGHAGHILFSGIAAP
jgi:hypothetical protein